METRITDFKSLTIKLASPERILTWSKGEVTKPETINYRTQRPEKDGLFDERIFGPEKDFECYCGKYKRVRYKGIICDKCGVEVTRAIVRRERMGHISLASPVSHIWFLRGVPSHISMLLDISVPDLEKVIYFAGYIITKVDEKKRKDVQEALDKEYKSKLKSASSKEDKEVLKGALDKAKSEIKSLVPAAVISEVEYHRLSLKYGDAFEADIGSEALRKICSELNLRDLLLTVEKELPDASPIQKKKIQRRIRLIRTLLRSGVKSEWMFLTQIPVIPPALRPMVQLEGGRHATSDINDLYRRVINRNNRLKKLLDLKAPEVIVRNEKRMLQEAVDSLIDNSIKRNQGPAATSQAQKRPLRSLADMLKGKQGRFRQNLLGKRVDYSGRSVIVVGPDLKLSQCGLPKHMALELFRPFVIQKLIKRGLAHTIKGAGRLIDDLVPEVWESLEEVIEGKHVLLNRAPTLHRLGIQAFKPILIEGNAIQLHPLVCSAFNADFDGDQMAVHVPLTDEAQREARDIMASNKNLFKPGNGDPVVIPTQDIVMGIFYLTRIREGAKGEGKYFSSPNEAILAYDFDTISLQAKIFVKTTKTPKYQEAKEILETSVGRLIFNSVIPRDYPYINSEMKKKDLERLVADAIQRYGVDATPPILDHIKSLGYKYATKSGISWGMDDIQIPKEKNAFVEKAKEEARVIENQYNLGLLTDKERYEKVIFIWSDIKAKIDEKTPALLDKYGPIHYMVGSGARGQWNQINQIASMKGLVVNPSGRIIELPIISSYKEGLNVLEYFISTHAARKGTADTALKTAVAGYLTRRLVDVSQDVIISEPNCKDEIGLPVYRRDYEKLGKNFAHRISGRVLAADVLDPRTGAGDRSSAKVLFKKGTLLSNTDAEIIASLDISTLALRSPVTCRISRGMCQLCYGYDLGSHTPVKLGEAVGIVAAQAIGEPGTQLTMRTFHVGGIAGAADITMGLPRVEEIFEIRAPKVKAIISNISGKVIDISESKEGPSGEKVIKVLGDESTSGEFIIPFGKTILVAVNETIEKGAKLTEGSIDIKDLFLIAGISAVQNYIISEVQQLYTFQGASINDKHLEIIVRQMFSRVRIKDSGSTQMNVGEIVEKGKFREENMKIKMAGGTPAKAVQLVMGITNVALTTESYLSAASFMQTMRVLTNAAVEAKEDKLRGLKENVIIGRLIPAGTGYRKEYLKKLEMSVPAVELKENV